MTGLSLVYITAPSVEEAEKIGDKLLSSRLAACANIFSGVTSLYRWDGKYQRDTEAVLILKTRTALLPDIEKTVRSLHSYDTPCIVSVPLNYADKDFAEWVEKETSGTDPDHMDIL